MAGATLLARRGRRTLAATAGGVLLNAGAITIRWSVFKAGSQSAGDPKYTVGPQRSRIERGISGSDPAPAGNKSHMEEQEPQKLADELEHEADRLEHRADELGSEIDDVRSDWKRKRNDSNVPGAPPEEEPAEDEDAPSEPEDQPG